MRAFLLRHGAYSYIRLNAVSCVLYVLST